MFVEDRGLPSDTRAGRSIENAWVTSNPADRHRLARRIGLVVVFLWFFIGGIAHFVATDVETSIVPPWVPSPRLMVLISGVFELLGAAGLVWPPTRRAAGWDSSR